MIYFENNKLVNFEKLRQAVNEDGNRVYSEELLQGLENGYFNCLYELDINDRNNKYFMEPLLYAVKYHSEFSTYEVYKYYGEELQKSDLRIAAEIVLAEPNVLEDTVICDNSAIVLYLARINPEIILYISEDLKSDGDFVEELCETGDREAIMYAARTCNISDVLQDNPELAKNPIFMVEAIKEDETLVIHLPEELKNDYKFMREVSMENTKVIDYVADHTEEFGKEAIEAARDSLEEKVLTETKKKVEEEKTQLETKEEKLTPEQATRKERDLNAITRMIKRFEEADTPEKKGRMAHIILAITGMEQYQNMEEYSNGVVHEKINPEFIKELEKYEKLYLAAREKTEMNKQTIEPQEVEDKVSADARLSEIQEETLVIKEEITQEPPSQAKVEGLTMEDDE